MVRRDTVFSMKRTH